MYSTKNFSVKAQKALQVFHTSAEYHSLIPIEARARLYQDLALMYHVDKAKLSNKATQAILALPIEERFEVLKVIDSSIEDNMAIFKENDDMEKADDFRKFQRCFEDSIFSENADQLANIMVALPYEKRPILSAFIRDCEKKIR